MAGSFSFGTPEEVMHVLASIRSSSLNADQKSDLRDLVLAYMNGGKDPALKIQIEQRLVSLGVTPHGEPTRLAVLPDVQHPFGSSRSTPTFAVMNPPVTDTNVSNTEKSSSHNSESSAPEKNQVEAENADKIESAPVPTTTPVPESTPQPERVAVTPVESVGTDKQQNNSTPPQPSVVQPASSEEVVLPASPVTHEESEDAQEQVNTDPSPVSSVEEKQPASITDPLTRIREIKALVNEKVGNPVNLVDIDNTIGREYMAALLEAMKRINDGSGAGSAMDRLETAFAAVQDLLDGDTLSHDEEVQQPVTPVDDGKESRSSAPQKVPPRSNGSNDVDRWANTDIRITPSTITKQNSKADSSTIEKPFAQPTSDVSTIDSSVDQSQSAQPVPHAVPAVPVAAQANTPDSTPELSQQSRIVKPISEVGAPLKSMSDVLTSDSLESGGGDPLMTAEVTDGLNQLLHSWVLFKKSGLFGTGPKGIEHPLFQKIKDLEIPILLAGRFDGATQEIKQSITDYMNGWRYEQGIIYEQGETFEHYLRRVIRHILDLQK